MPPRKAVLPANVLAIAVELDGLSLPDPAADPFAPEILRRLLEDRHERALCAMGFSREAKLIQRRKRAIAREWLRILEAKKHDIQLERCSQREPYPDLAGYEVRFRWNMLRIRILLALHFAGIRGLEERCQRLIRPIVAAVRPPAEIIPFPFS